MKKTFEKSQFSHKNLKVKKIEEPEHNTGADRYLITYADLITLLLGLFVILYAVSQVDKTKFAVLSEAMAKYFNPTTGKVIEGGSGELNSGKAVLPQPAFHNKETETSTIEQVYNQIENKLNEYINQGKISILKNNNSVTLVLPEVLFFPSAKSNILPQSYPILDSIVAILKDIPFDISVDGHTDAVPIQNKRYESNWHLSVDRALNVGYYMILKGLPEKDLSIRGYGPERPVDDNSTLEGRQKNRRVEITISKMSSNTASSTDNKNDSTKF